jgi:hypothetical protein
VDSFINVAAAVVTTHESGMYRKGASAAADHVVEAVGKYGKWVVLAAAELHESWPDAFEDIPADKVMEFLEENYLHAGATIAHALETYAKDAGDHTELGRLYDALDKAGGVDRFDWASYADDGMTPTIGLHFVVMPVPAGENSVFIFGS